MRTYIKSLNMFVYLASFFAYEEQLVLTVRSLQRIFNSALRFREWIICAHIKISHG